MGGESGGGGGEGRRSVGVKAHVASTGDSGNLRLPPLVKLGRSWDPRHSPGAALCRDKLAPVTLWRREGQTANTTGYYGPGAFSIRVVSFLLRLCLPVLYYSTFASP